MEKNKIKDLAQYLYIRKRLTNIYIFCVIFEKNCRNYKFDVENISKFA